MKNTKNLLCTGIFLMAMAITLGAFGAHALKEQLAGKYLETFEVGVRYQFYNALGLMLIALVAKNFEKLDLKLVGQMILAGTILFSGNCYLYAITQIKTFAMIVPIGGSIMIAGWFWFFALVKRRL
jgi:uncharacterized membrane protein YgdD (TMEM256/DUF423 family)